MNQLFQDNTPEIKTVQFDLPKYNRHERRTGTFVLRNKLNGKFIKRTAKGEKITFEDVELKDASRYSFVGVKYLIGEAMQHTNIDIEYRMVYLSKNKQIQFK